MAARHWLTIPAALIALASICEARAGDGTICEGQMHKTAAAEGVPLGVLYAVGLTETGVKGSLHPYALNITGRAVITRSKAEALAEFARARKKGHRLIDLGCMQVNHHYHGSAFRSPADMLDPAQNVTYAARFLKRLRAQEGSWTMAVARYHAGPDNDPAQKRYICAVIKNLVATGFGNWTREARQFCPR